MHVLSPDPLDGTLVRHRIHPLLDSETIGNSRHFYSQSGFDKYIYSISRKYKNASSDCLMQIAGEEERGVGYCEVGHIDGEAAMGITDGNGGRANERSVAEGSAASGMGHKVRGTRDTFDGAGVSSSPRCTGILKHPQLPRMGHWKENTHKPTNPWCSRALEPKRSQSSTREEGSQRG